MEFSHLKTLIHVAELGSLSKAADRLGIAQPALSRQVRLLEHELGVTLFSRHGRGMQLTDVGQEILAHAGRVMIELESIQHTAASGRSQLRGTVQIGMPPTVAEIITVPLISHIRSRHPELGIRINSAFSGHLLDWLQRGELEIAVSYDPEPQRSLKIQPILTEELLFVTKGLKGVPGPKTISFRDVAERELVLPGPRHGLRNLLDFHARQAGLKLHASIEAESFSTMVDLVKAGFGDTILPMAPLQSLVTEGSLITCRITEPQISRRLVIAHSTDRHIGPAARFVGQAIREIAVEFVQQGVWGGTAM